MADDASRLEFSIERPVQTASSRRIFLSLPDGQRIALLEIHHLPERDVAGTLVVFEDGPLTPDEVPEFLEQVTRTLLPDSREQTFTVVFGRLAGVCATRAPDPPGGETPA